MAKKGSSCADSGSGWWQGPNQRAVRSPGKLVVFFRWGPGSTPAGNAFAFPPDTGAPVPADAPLPSPDVRYVAFYNSSSLVAVNISTFVHEIGHYLGLFHTFPGWCDALTSTPALASAKIIAADGDQGLDGDFLADTPPDPGTAYYTGFVDSSACLGPATFAIGVTNFSPDRQNIMSYFGGCQPPYSVSAEQVQRIRAALRHPSRSRLVRAF
jgi:hypothetical protein